MTDENVDALLAAARYKSKREIEELTAALKPLADIAPLVRQLPTKTSPSSAETATRVLVASLHRSPPIPVATSTVARSTANPVAPERFKVQFTISRETRDKLRQVQDLMRHVIPDGDPAKIFDRALMVLLADLERKKFAATSTPRRARQPDDGSRHIPAAVRREVWHRDGGQCAFVGSRGRCVDRGFLEFHHLVPFLVGGAATVGTSNCAAAATTPMKRRSFLPRKTRAFWRL